MDDLILDENGDLTIYGAYLSFQDMNKIKEKLNKKLQAGKTYGFKDEDARNAFTALRKLENSD